jgi:hypothetical protein
MNQNTHPQFQKIPLTLGISGHRDPRDEDVEILKESVRKIFHALQQDYPNTPLQLLSPLADGADRLVAQVALQEKVRLIVPLPMPRHLYEQDFDEASQREFEDLLAQAGEEQIFTLPLVDGNTEADIADYGEPRTQQYGLVGAFIARHSHILIALWDSVHLEKPAGTSQVVQFKRTGNMKGLPEGYKPPHSPLDSPDMGAVCQVVTARKQNMDTQFTVGDIRVLLPNDQEIDNLEDLLAAETKLAASQFSSELVALNQFNRDVEKHTANSAIQHSIQASQKHLLPPKLWEALPTLAPGFQNLLGVYGTANALAKHFQARIKSLGLGVLGLAFAMVGFYGWYANIDHSRPLILGIYASLFVGVLVLVGITTRQRYHSKALDYRALAEGLRVQIFWQLGGLTHSVSDYYLRKQRDELAWIRSSIRALNIYDWIKNQQTLDVVHGRWVMFEKGWFSKTAAKKCLKARWLNGTIKALFGLGITCMVGMWIDSMFGEWLWKGSILAAHPAWHNFLILLIALFPATGALLHHFAEKMAFEEEAKQYYRMGKLFETAHQKLKNLLPHGQTDATQPDTSSQATQVLFELGKEALEENGDWVLIHRKPPLKVPF